MRVAFFQRIFAHYQWGLVHELAHHADHEYVFYGDTRDPAGTGIAPLPAEWRDLVDYRPVRTWQPAVHLALQPAAMRTALSAEYDAFIFEGSLEHPTTWIAMQLARARGKRVLLYTHGWRREDTNATLRATRLAFYRQADALLLYGFRAKSIGRSLGIMPDGMHVAFNSLNYREMVVLRDTVSQDQSLAVRERLFGNGELPVAIYVGRLIASKRVDLLLEGCAKVAARGYRLGLLIVGDGPERKSLEDKAMRLGIPTHFAGALHDERELCSLISASMVMVVPGYVGLSAIHAMTYGVPIITNDDLDSHSPEVEAIIPGRTGEFFRSGDPDSLAEALLPFLATSGGRASYSPCCKEMVDRYYNPAFMRSVFDRAVSGRPAEDALLFGTCTTP
jgi:glycosyltransferase involved in cell wall biosynthesis